MPASDSPEKRIFSFEEATAILPDVRRLTEQAYRRVAAIGAHAMAAGTSESSVQDELNGIVADWAASLVERGIEVKGLWLVDFDNGSGYYCWQYPEDGLQYYHSYEDGFQGRMRIQ